MRRSPGVLHGALVLAVVAAGVGLRAINLGGPAFGFDEYYHALAARSVVAGEGFYLPSGRPYGRAELVTLLTAGAFALFGESEAAARLPALLFGTATLVLVYLVGRRLFGPPAGLVALLLLAVSPDAVDIDRFARLYSPLAFFVLLAALAAFLALESGDGGERAAVRRRLVWLAVAAAAGLVALHLHPVALGLAVVVQAYAAIMAAGLLVRGRRREAAPYAAAAAGILLLEAAGAAVPGLRASLVEAAVSPLPWYRPAPGDEMFYHYDLATRYAWLWYLVWPATVAVVVARPRQGLFVALAFWLPFVLLSGVVATRATRYVAHLLPFAWLLLGGAAGLAWPSARTALAERLRPYLPTRVPAPLASAAVVLVALVPVLRLSPSVVVALGRPWQTTGAFTTGQFADWRGLGRELRARLSPGARVVSNVPAAVRYYLDRPASHLIAGFRRRGAGDWEMPTRRAEDQVQRAQDLAALLAAGTPVWVVTERRRWAEADYYDAGLKRAIETGCRAVPVPRELTLIVFECEGDRGRHPSPAGSRRRLPARLLR